jgi:hypothetical protein
MAALVTATLAEPGMMGERIEQRFVTTMIIVVTTMIIVVIVHYDDDVIIVVIVHYDDDDHRKPARQRARWSLWRAFCLSPREGQRIPWMVGRLGSKAVGKRSHMAMSSHHRNRRGEALLSVPHVRRDPSGRRVMRPGRFSLSQCASPVDIATR